MSLTKDLVDLITQLYDTIRDRKTRELLLPIREKVQCIEREQLELEKTQFKAERKYAENIDNLKASHTKEISQLQASHIEEVARLQMEKSQIEEKLTEFQKAPPIVFDTRIGTYRDVRANLHYCTICWRKTPRVESPLRTANHGWNCDVCDKFYLDPDDPPPSSFPVRAGTW